MEVIQSLHGMLRAKFVKSFFFYFFFTVRHFHPSVTWQKSLFLYLFLLSFQKIKLLQSLLYLFFILCISLTYGHQIFVFIFLADPCTICMYQYLAILMNMIYLRLFETFIMCVLFTNLYLIMYVTSQYIFVYFYIFLWFWHVHFSSVINYFQTSSKLCVDDNIDLILIYFFLQ